MVKEESMSKAIKEEISSDADSKKERYELVSLPTATEIFIQDKKNSKIFNNQELLLEILNKLDNIERAVK